MLCYVNTREMKSESGFSLAMQWLASPSKALQLQLDERLQLKSTRPDMWTVLIHLVEFKSVWACQTWLIFLPGGHVAGIGAGDHGECLDGDGKPDANIGFTAFSGKTQLCQFPKAVTGARNQGYPNPSNWLSIYKSTIGRWMHTNMMVKLQTIPELWPALNLIFSKMKISVEGWRDFRWLDFNELAISSGALNSWAPRFNLTQKSLCWKLKERNVWTFWHWMKLSKIKEKRENVWKLCHKM